jgi:hypothetical protein
VGTDAAGLSALAAAVIRIIPGAQILRAR